MERIIILLFVFIPFLSYAQITSSVTSDKTDYVFGEIIKITMTISNNSEDQLVTYQGSGSLKAVIKSFSGVDLTPIVVTADDYRDTIKVGEKREIRWQLDPSELALPPKAGEQTVIVRGLSVIDSVKFNAPKFTGGKLFLYFENETETEIINQIKDSLDVSVINEDHPSYIWYLHEFMIDSVIIDLLKRDYVLEARVPGREEIRPIAYISTGTEENNYILDFKLYQNYPNPFNPSTVISFALKKPGHVKLSIFDLAGKEVAVIQNNRFSAGNHSIHFNAEYLASGIYIYRLETRDKVISKKFTLIK